ncbi:hypothetical protein NN561_019974 [Cricetulus griseus]
MGHGFLQLCAPHDPGTQSKWRREYKSSRTARRRPGQEPGAAIGLRPPFQRCNRPPSAVPRSPKPTRESFLLPQDPSPPSAGFVKAWGGGNAALWGSN